MTGMKNAGSNKFREGLIVHTAACTCFNVIYIAVAAAAAAATATKTTTTTTTTTAATAKLREGRAGKTLELETSNHVMLLSKCRNKNFNHASRAFRFRPLFCAYIPDAPFYPIAGLRSIVMGS